MLLPGRFLGIRNAKKIGAKTGTPVRKKKDKSTRGARTSHHDLFQYPILKLEPSKFQKLLADFPFMLVKKLANFSLSVSDPQNVNYVYVGY